jgi:hypothetical protein
MNNILNSDYVMKLMHIWVVQWLIRELFIFAKACHKNCNITKGLKIKNLIKFVNENFHIQRDNYNEQSAVCE